MIAPRTTQKRRYGAYVVCIFAQWTRSKGFASSACVGLLAFICLQMFRPAVSPSPQQQHTGYPCICDIGRSLAICPTAMPLRETNCASAMHVWVSPEAFMEQGGEVVSLALAKKKWPGGEQKSVSGVRAKAESALELETTGAPSPGGVTVSASGTLNVSEGSTSNILTALIIVIIVAVVSLSFNAYSFLKWLTKRKKKHAKRRHVSIEETETDVEAGEAGRRGGGRRGRRGRGNGGARDDDDDDDGNDGETMMGRRGRTPTAPMAEPEDSGVDDGGERSEDEPFEVEAETDEEEVASVELAEQQQQRRATHPDFELFRRWMKRQRDFWAGIVNTPDMAKATPTSRSHRSSSFARMKDLDGVAEFTAAHCTTPLTTAQKQATSSSWDDIGASPADAGNGFARNGSFGGISSFARISSFGGSGNVAGNGNVAERARLEDETIAAIHKIPALKATLEKHSQRTSELRNVLDQEEQRSSCAMM